MSNTSKLWWTGIVLMSIGATAISGAAAGLCLAGAGFVIAAMIAYLDGGRNPTDVDDEFDERQP